MDEYPYYNGGSNVIIFPKDIIYYQSPVDLWMWNRRKYNNGAMAMMLIDVLHKKGLINNITYKNIYKKIQLQ